MIEEQYGAQFYETYPIRCKTSGHLISVLHEQYQQLLMSGLGIEEALDTIGLQLPCCRSAMMIPVQWPRIKENREKVFFTSGPELRVANPGQDRQGKGPIFMQGFTAANAPPLTAVTIIQAEEEPEQQEIDVPRQFGIPVNGKGIYFKQNGSEKSVKVASSTFMT